MRATLSAFLFALCASPALRAATALRGDVAVAWKTQLGAPGSPLLSALPRDVSLFEAGNRETFLRVMERAQLAPDILLVSAPPGVSGIKADAFQRALTPYADDVLARIAQAAQEDPADRTALMGELDDLNHFASLLPEGKRQILRDVQARIQENLEDNRRLGLRSLRANPLDGILAMLKAMDARQRIQDVPSPEDAARLLIHDAPTTEVVPAKAAMAPDPAYLEIRAFYGLTDRLGAGGQGQVWAGSLPKKMPADFHGYPALVPGKPVAVKIRGAWNTAAHEDAVSRRLEAVDGEGLFVRAARDSARDVLVMEDLRGFIPLPEWVANAGVPHPGALHIIEAQLRAALAALRKAGLVHGDLKPGNIRIGPGYRLKIGDFGAAADVGGHGPHGLRFGTFAWSSPNQLQNGRAEFADDEYTVELLLGRLKSLKKSPSGASSAK